MDNLIINVNSCFTDKTKYTSSNFVYHLDEEIKNIAYIKLGSIEYPSSLYIFREEKRNTSFKIGDGTIEDTITIQDGNYTTDILAIEINDRLELINDARNTNYMVDVNVINGKLEFTSDTSFTLNFTNDDIGYGSLGYHMGFDKNNYLGDSTIIGDKVMRLNYPIYYFLLCFL